MVFRRLADGLGNDRDALIAFLRRPQRPLTAGRAGPRSPAPCWSCSATRIRPARATAWSPRCPDARLVTLRGVDHFGTPADVRCMQAVLGFLGC